MDWGADSLFLNSIDRVDGGCNRPAVLLIERELTTATSLLALNLDKKRFKTFDPAWTRKIGYKGYIDEKAGLILKAFNGGIFQLDYIAKNSHTEARAEQAQCS